MKYFKAIPFIFSLLIFQAKAQVKSNFYNLDSIQKMVNNIRKSVKIPKGYNDIKDLPGLPATLPFLDSNSEEQKNYSAVVKKIGEVLKQQLEKGDKKGIAASYLNLGSLNIKMNNPAAAKQNLQNSVQISKELNDKNSLANAYNNLSLLDNHEGNYKEAYEYYKLYTLYRDSVENAEISKKFLQAQLKHDYEIKEANEKALQAKKDAAEKRTRNIQYLIIISLGVVIVAAFVILFIQRRNNKQKHEANQLLQSQKEKVEGALSELKATQAQLIQSEKMASLGELTAGIAHEIQNPLNFVNNFSEINKELLLELKDEIGNGNVTEAKTIATDIIENEEKINHHGKRADAIVKGMLQHSRSGSGQKELVDINALADEYLQLSFHGLRARDKLFNVLLEKDFDKTAGKIKAVPQDIGRVLLNLFNNAFYAVNEKKKLLADNYQPATKVETRRINDKVEITVSDNGNGIPEKIVDKIFQPFFTTKPTGQGTGLGLSLSYDIVKAHGGDISLETTEGKGTTFLVQLPLS
jgi:signal transduction histidine kinase